MAGRAALWPPFLFLGAFGVFVPFLLRQPLRGITIVGAERNMGSALLLKFALRISAFLGGSAVISPYSILTADPQRNAEIRRVEIRAPLKYDPREGSQ